MNSNSLQPASRNPQPARHAHAGFTLVELLIVISIVILLVGLGVAGMSMLYQNSDESRAKIILGGLQTILTEYEAQTGQTLSSLTINSSDYPDATDNGDATTADSYDDRMAWFVARVQKIDTCKKMLESLGKRGQIVIYDTDDTDPNYDPDKIRTIKDPWDQTIVFFQDNPENSSHLGATDNNVEVHDTSFFMSYGADGKLGVLTYNSTTKTREPAAASVTNSDANSDGAPDAEDNLYSYDLD